MNWTKAKLGEIGKFYSGLSGKTAADFGSGSPFISYNSVFGSSRCFIAGQPLVRLEQGERQNTVSNGDIILTGSSETAEEVAMSSLYCDQAQAYLNSFCIGFSYDHQRLMPCYAEYFFRGQEFRRSVFPLAQGSTRFNISREELTKVVITLPSLAEQRKIAEILRTWDEAIEAVGAEISRLKERLVSLIAKLTLRLCVGKPEQGWHDVKIGELLEEVDRDVEWEDAKMFSLISCGRRASGIFLREKKAGSDIDVKKMYEVQAGDFIVSQKQSAHAGWGMVTKEFHGHHVSPMYTIYGLKGKGLHMPFFNWLCKTPWMRHQAYLSSYGVHIEKMSFVSRLFLKTKIRIPALLTDQEKACAILESTESEIKAATLKLEKLNDQKRGLMQKLLTGEVRVAV
jgi:type I restriction enzyme S subunit